MPIRLLIADDHPVLRSGLVNLLADTEIEVVAQASTGDEAVRLTKEHNPDVVLLDVRMPDGEGLTALSRIQVEQPSIPVLMFSNYDIPEFAAKSLALGAVGYLLKSCSRNELVASIRDAAQGKDSWSREKLREIVTAIGTPQRKTESHPKLTPRQSEVLLLVVDGKRNKEIAEQLSISPETVKEHTKHMFSKIGVRNRTQAAVWAVRNGVV